MVLTPAWRRCMVRERGRPQRCSRRTGINFIYFKASSNPGNGVASIFENLHGQTLADRTIPGPSFQL
jgi:hypothetical protein